MITRKRHYTVSLLTVLVLLLGTCIAFAQESQFTFKTYTTKDGLAHNYTKKVVQDKNGFIWIATLHGLSRFDGLHFNNYHFYKDSRYGLANENCNDLIYDSMLHRLFVCHEKGIQYLNLSNYLFTTVPLPDSLQLVYSIYYSATEQSLYFTCSRGFYNYNLLSKKLTCIKSIVLNNENNYTATSTIQYNAKQKQLKFCQFRKGYYVYYIVSKQIRHYTNPIWPMAFIEDLPSHKNYISTWQGGLLEVNDTLGIKATYNLEVEKGDSFVIFSNGVCAPQLTGDSILWVATAGTGIALFNERSKLFVQNIRYQPENKTSIQSNFFSSVFRDINGNLWFASWYGLVMLSGENKQIYSTEISFLNNRNYNLVEGIVKDPTDPNTTWMAANGQGLIAYHSKTKAVLKSYFNDGPINGEANYSKRWVDFLAPVGNSIITNTLDGLTEIKGKQLYYHPILFGKVTIPYYLNAIPINDHCVWLTGRQGLVYYDLQTREKRLIQTPTDIDYLYLNGLTQASNGTLYVQNQKHIYTYTNGENYLVPLQLPPLKSQNIMCISIDELDNLWIGTNLNLWKYNLVSKQLTPIGADEDLNSFYKNDVYADHRGSIWAYSSHALYRINITNNTITTYTTDNGLYNASQDVSRLFTFEDHLYVGYRMAYSRISLTSAPVKFNVSKPYLTELLINQKRQYINLDSLIESGLTLPYLSNNIKLSFAIPNYSTIGALDVVYQLQGWNNNWNKCSSSSSFEFTQLHEGTYTLLIKVSSSYSKKVITYKLLKLTIQAPFYRTWWFILLCILLIAALLTIFFRLRLKQIRKRVTLQQDFEKKIAAVEMQALKAQMNPHFIFNCLNSIDGYILENEKQKASDYLNKFAKLIRQILYNSNLDEIPVWKELEVLQLYIELEQIRCDYHFDYVIDAADTVMQGDFKVPPSLLQPFIENAILHGLIPKETKGKLVLKAFLEADYLAFEISDDGIGREKSKAMKQQLHSAGYKSYGMKIASTRIEIYNQLKSNQAGIEIIDLMENGLACGTKVIVKIKL